MLRNKGVVKGGALVGLLLIAMVMTGCDVNNGSGPEVATGGTPNLSISSKKLEYLITQNSNNADSALIQILELNSDDGSLVDWALVTDTPWITLESTEGQTSTEIDKVGIGILPTQLTPGVHRGSITIASRTVAGASIQEVIVTVRVCEGTCISVNISDTSHEISPLLFGSQSEYLNSGTGIWDSITTNDCADPAIPVGVPHQAQLDEFMKIGIGFLRYPSGIPTDFFQWSESVGPITSRIPQINPWDSTFGDIRRECPVFGPDEFAEFAGLLNAPMLITTNAGTGTAQDAADWLTHYENNGVNAEYWEIGNELYIEGTAYLFSPYKTPQEYGAAFDAHARALRQVNPNVKVGAVFSPTDQAWNRAAVAAIKEPFDFATVHSFQPQIDTCNEPSDFEVYYSLLASPLLMETQLQLIRSAVKELGAQPDKETLFSITEWGPWFLHFCNGNIVKNNDARARTMASALFSGSAWNFMMRDPSVFSAFHSALSSQPAQATLNIVPSNGTFIPIRSAHYYVQKLYVESAGGLAIPTTTRNSPVFSARLFDNAKRVEQPVLDSIAVLSKDKSKVYVYIVNRSLTEAVDYQLFFIDLPGMISTIDAETVLANDFSDENTIAQVDAVGMVKTVLATDEELRLRLQAHSLVRITLTMVKN